MTAGLRHQGCIYTGSTNDQIRGRCEWATGGDDRGGGADIGLNAVIYKTQTGLR